MISMIYGKFAGWEDEGVIVETQMGIAFVVHCPERAVEGIGPGDGVRLYVHVHYGQNGPELYGFSSSLEREIFRKLMAARGVGPKGALSLLNTLTPKEIVEAVVLGDARRLTQAKGIGPKGAKKLIVELRDTFEKMGGLPSPDLSPSQMKAVQEAQEALRSLGYSREEISAVLPDINELAAQGLEVEEIVTEVLRIM